MSLQTLLFEPTLIRSPLRILHWWERRRPLYNLIVGTVGLGTLCYAELLSLIARGQWLRLEWQVIVAYGLVANLFYTLGPIAENLTERWLGRPVYGVGPALFRHGLVFSIGLTLFPAAVVTFFAIGGLLFP
ncbi:MAG TPA: hypothetical protein VKH19_18020 [Gemmatimonadaceae bacterium]|nr:hypothetical protein [Gemmatimonadaceae bacterium]